MNARATDLLREALALPSKQRADFAAELLASLDDDDADIATIESEWAAEIERRARRVMSGESRGIPADDVRREIEAELRKR